jgi:methyl-accepting chemotaxis protein
MMNLSSLSKAVILIACAMTVGAAGLALGLHPGILCFSAVFLIGAVYYVYRVRQAVFMATAIIKKLGLGDFEARVLDIKPDGEVSEFLWSVNETADSIDSYVRESAAAMLCVSRNQYFRRILEDGMNGALLNGARVINKATEAVAEKMGQFSDVANDVDVSLKSVVSQINEAVGTLEVSSGTMQQTVSSTRSGADIVVDSANEASGSVQAISAAAEEMSASVGEISAQITKTSQMAGQAVQTAHNAKAVVNVMEETAENISKVISMIEDIAKQTNLLALNATIEAARAGEAGKGFAVVASEVKELAGQTGQATEEIKQQIVNVQEVTRQAIESFENIGKVIADIDEACAVVAAAVEEQNAASREIASSAEKASSATDSVAKSIRVIGGDIGEVDTIGGRVSDATRQLSSQCMDEVKSLLSKMDNFMQELKKIA